MPQPPLVEIVYRRIHCRVPPCPPCRVINELPHESRPLPRSEPLLGLLHRKVVTKPVVLHRHRLVGKEAGRASIFDQREVLLLQVERLADVSRIELCNGVASLRCVRSEEHTSEL